MTDNADTTNEELATSYADLRRRCLELGRSLSPAQASVTAPCCPAWTVRDLYAHMAGVPVDILEGNLDGAATESWADAHVARRAGDSLTRICDEWEGTAAAIDDLMAQVGSSITVKFFLDAWTHEWDIRQAIGEPAAVVPDLRLAEYSRPFLLDEYQKKAEVGQEPMLDAIASIPVFELARASMGRRSEEQIRSLGKDLTADFVVFWSANPADIVDPVLS